VAPVTHCLGWSHGCRFRATHRGAAPSWTPLERGLAYWSVAGASAEAGERAHDSVEHGLKSPLRLSRQACART
jgi:hypothetical protein